MNRYVVTELEGFPMLESKRRSGLSCAVIDTAWNRRVVAAYRSEDYARARGTVASIESARAEAYSHAARLNGEPQPEQYRRSWVFRPKCPTCGTRVDPDAAYCSCGKNLYRREVGH